MDGGTGAGALSVLVAVVGVAGRWLMRVDRHERAQARRPDQPRMVARSPLLGEPRVVRPVPVIEDERPPVVEVPDRMFVRAARIVAVEQRADAELLVRHMRVIPAMAERLMMALRGRGVIGQRDLSGAAEVLVGLDDLPGLFARWGIVEDA